MKNRLTQAGIETATFRFVAQHLNHCATAVPHKPEDQTKSVSTHSAMLVQTLRIYYLNFEFYSNTRNWQIIISCFTSDS